MTPKLVSRLEWLQPQTQKSLLWLVNGDIAPLSMLGDFSEQREKYPDIRTGANLEEPHYLLFYRRYEQILYVADILCGTHGNECIRLSEYDKRHDYSGSGSGICAAYYLNTGETYAPTLVYRYDIVKRWDIMCYGDLVETLERKGYKLA